MDHRAVRLIFLIQLASALRKNETINVFDYCSDGVNYVLVPNDTRIAAVMKGEDWPVDSYICTVVFRAPHSLSQLYYKFTSFHTNQSEFEIATASKEFGIYQDKDPFSLSNPPVIGQTVYAEKYLRMTIIRKGKQFTSISATFEVLVIETDKGEGHLQGHADVIVGSVVGFVVFVAVCVLFVYLRYRFVLKRAVQRDKENRAAEVKGTRVQVPPEEVPMYSPSTTTPVSETLESSVLDTQSIPVN